MATIGDTIRLKAEFRTWNGIAADPDNIVLRIYDSYRKQIGDDILIGSEHRTGPGAYQYDYIVTNQSKPTFFEFSGMLEGKPIVGRSEIEVNWL